MSYEDINDCMTGDQDGARSDTLVCSRKMKDGNVCGTEIPLERENLKVTKPEVPLLSCVCPGCGFHRILDGATSKRLGEVFFKDEIEAAQVASGKMKTSDIPQGDEGSLAVPPPPLSPSADIASRVGATLILLGYNSKAWKERIEVIQTFVQQVPGYQTPDGLRMLLQAMGIDALKVHLTLQRIFAGVEMIQQQQMMGAGSMTGWGQGLPGGMSTGGSMVQTPSGQVPTVQMTPGGPVIVMPAQAQAAAAREANPDAITIEEKLDEHGNVKARVIRGPREKLMERAGSADSSILQTVGMLKELGLFGKEDTSDAKVDKIMSGMVEVVKQMAAQNDGLIAKLESTMREPKRTRDDETKEEISGLREELKKVTDSQQQAVVAGVMNRLGSIEARLAGVEPTPVGLSEEQQRALSNQKQTQTIMQTVERVGDRILEPIMEMNKQQARLNGLMAIRQMAYQDGVPPEYYLRALASAQEPPSDEVSARVAEWRARAEAVRQQQAMAQAQAAAQQAAQQQAAHQQAQQTQAEPGKAIEATIEPKAPEKKKRELRIAGMK